MIVTLDGQRVDDEHSPGCTLTALLDRVRATQPPERLLVSVSVNGRCLDELELGQQLPQPLAPDDQVDLESGERHAVVSAALRDVAAKLAEAARLQPEIADELNRGRAAEALPRVAEVVQVWNTCSRAVVQCSGLLGRDLTQTDVQGHNVPRMLAELAAKLREVRDALDARDLVLLADLIQFEMPALCEAWGELLNGVADELEQPSRAGN